MSENLFGLTVAADKGLDDLQCQRLLSENRRYQEVMLQYRCALKALESRLEILNEEFSLQHDRNPIESMKSRLKSPSSIMNKMQKCGLSLDFPTMQANIMDIAGVRVICSFEEDEPKRLARLDGVKKVSLLAKYGMTEADAYKLCQDHGLLSPIYAHCRRNGCWFCPNASDSELLHMVTKHPDMFDRLIEWEKEDNIFHRRMTRRETPSEVKARLLSKSQTRFSSPKSK